MAGGAAVVAPHHEAHFPVPVQKKTLHPVVFCDQMQDLPVIPPDCM
jgi:hypothetical protein